MIHFDKNDISEGIDVNITNASKECDVCHYPYFLNYSFQFQPNVCKCLNDLLMFVNFSDIAILNVKGSDYHCIISLISKNQAINLMQNVDLAKKKWNIINQKQNFLKSHMKTEKTEKTVIKFRDIEIQKQKFYQPISIKNVHIDKIVVPNKVPFGKKGFKYFTGYKDAKINKTLCIFLPKMT